MQTPGEIRLIYKLCEFICMNRSTPRLLNVGAGRSTIIESHIARSGLHFSCDRIDVENCQVNMNYIGHCWVCSVEDMRPVPSDYYDAVWSNYVLEHVADLNAAASEIFRIVRPGGMFIATVPNIEAPEFIIAKHTSVGFHKMIRRADTWKTVYGYRSLADLVDQFVGSGFHMQELNTWACTEQYFRKLPTLAKIAKAYDKAVNSTFISMLKNNACLIVRKPESQ